MLTPQQIKEIEEKFDRELPSLYNESEDFKGELGFLMNNDIKSFIITTINNILAERDKWYQVSFICDEEQMKDFEKGMVVGKRQDLTIKEINIK